MRIHLTKFIVEKYAKFLYYYNKFFQTKHTIGYRFSNFEVKQNMPDMLHSASTIFHLVPARSTSRTYRLFSLYYALYFLSLTSYSTPEKNYDWIQHNANKQTYGHTRVRRGFFSRQRTQSKFSF